MKTQIEDNLFQEKDQDKEKMIKQKTQELKYNILLKTIKCPINHKNNILKDNVMKNTNN